MHAPGADWNIATDSARTRHLSNFSPSRTSKQDPESPGHQNECSQQAAHCIFRSDEANDIPPAHRCTSRAHLPSHSPSPPLKCNTARVTTAVGASRDRLMVVGASSTRAVTLDRE